MPDPNTIDARLRQSLDDGQLSRSERRVIELHLDDEPQTEANLALWRSRAFILARRTLDEGGGPEVLDWLEGVVKRLAHHAARSREAAIESAAYFTPGDSGPKAIAGLFDRTRTCVDVCVFTITDDRISSSILAAHRRGVELRVITDDKKAHDTGSDILEFRRAGIPLHTDRDRNHMHHKFAIFDRKILLNGSYNWTRGAAEYNLENIVTTSDPSLVSAFLQEFDHLWDCLG